MCVKLYLFVLVILVSGDEMEDARVASLKLHNVYRCMHNAPPLTIDPELNVIAQAYAEHLAEINQMIHSHAPGMGENLAYSWASTRENNMTKIALQGTKGWYDEVAYYHYNTPSVFTSQVGHFTQLIWTESTTVGIGIASINNTWYTVANYKPPGNWVGDENYIKNVQKPVKDPVTCGGEPSDAVVRNDSMTDSFYISYTPLASRLSQRLLQLFKVL